MKRLVIALLALSMLLSLTACGGRTEGGQGENSDVPAQSDDPSEPSGTEETPEAPEAEEPIYAPIFTRDRLPRFDGSTSTAPLAEAVCAAVLGESKEDVAGLISFSKTTNAYFNLLQGNADILIVGEANEDVMAEKEAIGFEWEQTPFATDAFVFVVNEANPVDSITVDEARRIYTGEITNWSELGGEDREIIPFQRNEGAGSQTLMEKLVMGGEPMMEAPTDWIATTMGELMEAVKGYDNSPGAIGYSVYYYAEEMRMAEGLKLLKLEGVEPNPQTIRSETYPLVNPKYVVIPAGLAEDDPARIIYDWLLSDSGQRLVAREGYVSILDVDTGERQIKPLVGSRWYEEYQPELQPGSYGSLLPYAGQRLMDDWPAGTGCLYGLMTLDGKVVVDPVYSSVSALGDILILRRGTEDGPRVAVAAGSGAWCTDFEYLAANLSRDGAVLFREDNISLIDRSGKAVATLTAEDMGISRERLDDMRYSAISGEGAGADWVGGRLSVEYNYDGSDPYVMCYDIGSGKLVKVPDEQWFSVAYPDTGAGEPAVKDAEFIYDAVRGESAPYLLQLTDYGDPMRRSYYLQDGTPLPELDFVGLNWYEDVRLVGGLIERTELNYATYYDMNTMKVVFRTYLGYEGD